MAVLSQRSPGGLHPRRGFLLCGLWTKLWITLGITGHTAGMDREARRREDNRQARREFAPGRERGVAMRHAARLRNLAHSKTVSPELRRLREKRRDLMRKAA